MWKDFFNFSKRERFTIVVLTFMIILVQVLIWTKGYWVKFLPEKLEKKYLQSRETEALRDSITSKKPTYQRFDSKKTSEVAQKLVPFNPNTADSLTLRGLGLRAYVVKNMLNYRRKGGQFKKPSDLSKIYGMEADVFANLEHLINFETPGGRPLTSEQKFEQQKSIDVNPNTVNMPVHPAREVIEGQVESPTAHQTEQRLGEPPVLEVNSADTTLLQHIKGVGTYTANQIARYRNQLGGFYSKSQLSEIKGLYPETLVRLQSMLNIDPTRIQTLSVNKASLEKLRAHPYLSFYQAKVIVELRKSRGKLISMDELKPFKEFTTQDLERLKWYLDFR
ncbi:MAG TPA: helix-hairpin-helix domain-containing protein [Bacteroidales bacterium]|nr:helix-hairpin-helix domain-containing protein [Bacteroidales bacterium]